MNPAAHRDLRVLLARQFDEPLTEAEAHRLTDHLAGCASCRLVAQGYADDRRRLRSLTSADPPRDLWARTRTALDHEVVRGDHRAAAISLGTLASLAAVLALIGSQVGNSTRLGPSAAPATPFAVTPQPLAFLTRQGDELAIFSTQVSEVCPPPGFDCPQGSLFGGSYVRVDSDLEPSGMALGSDGRILITGRDARGHAVFGIVRLGEPLGTGGPSGPGSSSPGSSVTGGATPTGPGNSQPNGTGPSPSPSGPGGSTAPPTRTPGVLPTPTPSGAPSGTPSALPQVQPILSDVTQTGAAAAWSPDGSMLAFSAMPADDSQGPDVYVWSPGDESARLLTHDHRSSFASWVGQQILVSRIASPTSTKTPAGSAPTAPAPGGPHAQTVLIDPADGQVSTIAALADAWLPSVDPTGRFVAFWRGTFSAEGPMIDPQAGRLWVSTWPDLAPAAGATSGGAASPTSATSPTPSASVDTAPPASHRHSAIASRPSPSGRPSPPGRASPAASLPAASTTSPSPATTTEPGPSALPLAASAGPISDWELRWADDGNALGVWLASGRGSAVGQLMVLAPPDPQTGQDAVLLAPTPAGRDAFAMGLDRVAWVAAGADAGDLRVATWGPLGPGGVRLRHLDVDAGVPAF